MENNQVGLTTEYGQGVALKSVHLEAKLDGLLLSATLSQKYINDTDETIEATYTFPLGWGTQLMGLAVELNGKRMEAMALLKKQAEKKYEKANIYFLVFKHFCWVKRSGNRHQSSCFCVTNRWNNLDRKNSFQ